MYKQHIGKYFRKLPFLVVIFGFLFLSPVYFPEAGSASARQNIKISLWPHEESDLKSDPMVVYGRFENGFRYALMENHEPKNRVNIRLVVQAGSMHEEDREEGLAHYLEHMLFNGSTHFKPGELVKYFQDLGMQFGHDANARTGFYETVYDIVLPDGKRESLDKGFLIAQDYAKGALLLDSEVEREKKVVLAKKRSRDSSSYRTYISEMKFKFPGAAISKRIPIGETAALEKMTSKKLKDFYDAWYRPENIILVVVGDFDQKTAVSLVRERFQKLSARAPPRPAPSFGDIKHN